MKKIFYTMMIAAVTAVILITSSCAQPPAYSEDSAMSSRFKVVYSERGSSRDTVLSIYVDTTTKVQYLYTCTSQSTGYGKGVGVGITILVDEYGNPLLYEGEL